VRFLNFDFGFWIGGRTLGFWTLLMTDDIP